MRCWPLPDPWPRRAPLAAGLLLCLGATLSGCDEGCVGGGEGCRVPSPCEGLSYSCGDDALEVRELTQQDAVLSRRGPNALASRGDVLLGNGQVVAVVSGLGHQNYLDPSGGTLLDLRTRDGADGLVQSLPIVGILPRDSAAYTERVLIDERPRRVAIQLRGTLFQQPDTAIYTLYEIRPCEPGVRVRTEVVNGTPDPQLWALMDGFYWSGREMLPFAPGLGFNFPSFGLLTIDDAFREAPLLAASTHSAPSASYALLSCSGATLSGFNSAVVSAMGLRKSIAGPRDYRVYERFLAVTGGRDVASAADVALRARAQLTGDRAVQLRGRVELQGRAGATIDGERGASVLISGVGPGADASRAPRTQVVPAADGSFSALVPAGGDYVVEVHAFGRKVAERGVAALEADRDLGAIPIDAAALVQLRVEDSDAMGPIDAEVFLVPADDATRAASAGSFHDVYERCAPWLGVPYGASPACNRALVSRAGGAQIEVPPGSYHFYAYHGPFYTIARQTVTLAPGQSAPLVFRLRPLPLLPMGAVSADLHVHGAASFDSSIPDRDRVLSFSAADVGVIIATDHDVVYDYGPVLAELGLQDRMSAVAGVETTGHIPFMKAPGNDFPLVIGHYNFWPLVYQPGLPRNGGPYDELVEPGELFDRVDPLYAPGRVTIAQLNHPWADPDFGRDLGFPRAIGLNLLDDLPDTDDGTPGGMYVRSPRGGHRNDDHQSQEVMNGTQNDLLLTYRAFWFYLLNQGRLRTGTANSDSHGLTDNTVGSPRNLVFAGTQAGPGFDVDRFNQAIRDGAVLGTNGPVILATVDARGMGEVSYGLKPIQPAPGGKLKLEVSAAPWVPVDEIRIVVNGQVVRRIDGAAIGKPADPFGSAGLLRYQGEVALSELLPPSGDAWLVVEAGTALPLAADLGGGQKTAEHPDGRPDGIPDTTDNNGDGKVDRADVDPGQAVGPLKNPPAPQPGEPRYHFAQVVPEGYPASFTNPFVFDRDGDGRFRPARVASAQAPQPRQTAQTARAGRAGQGR